MSWNTMEPFGWLLLALVLAVVADVVLIRLWQRHQAHRRRSPERRGAADGDGDGPEEPAAPGGPEPLPPGVTVPRPPVAVRGAEPEPIPAAPFLTGWVSRRLHELEARLLNALSMLRATMGKLELALFALAIGVYLITRFIGLDRFPIYFFTDEAVQTVLASDFVRDGFRDFNGAVFPTYFQNASLYNLSLSVYLQLIPYLLFGKSVLVTRGTAMLVTAIGAIGLGLTLKNIFHIRHWWAGVLFLSITPSWFLHSRTAFETTLMVSFYIWFLYLYLLYRTRSPRYLYASLILGGLVFYSYSPGQLIIFATGLFLLFSDLRYHWRNRRTGFKGLAMVALLCVPYLRFQLTHPGETVFHLRMLDSYLFHDIPWWDKARTLLDNYLHGLSLAYWYWPNTEDLPRHVMKGYGNILLATLPLALTGLVSSLRRLRDTEYRAVLIALLAAPMGMALVGVGLTRVLVFVFPAALLTTLGIEPIGRLVSRRLPSPVFAVALFALLTAYNLHMLDDSLTDGPTWFTNYGLYGMQYGGKQVFGEVEASLRQSPDTLVFVSSIWANGADILERFFLQEDDPVWMLDFDGLVYAKVEELDRMLFVLTSEEVTKLSNDPKFDDLRVEKTIPYPDGSIGFYFVHLAYSDEADAILAAERAERRQPVRDKVSIKGETVTIDHPAFDSGQVENLFDGDPFTLARSRKINPAVLILTFERPRSVQGLRLTTGTMDMTVIVRVYAGETAEPREYSATYHDLPEDPTIEFVFDNAPLKLTKVEISIQNLNDGPDGNVHIREIVLD